MEKPETPPPAGSFVPLLLAGVLMVAGFVTLFFLTLGWAGPILAIGGGIFALVALHYVVWGWWLSAAIRKEVEEEERNQ